jgi:hypothetical protein
MASTFYPGSSTAMYYYVIDAPEVARTASSGRKGSRDASTLKEPSSHRGKDLGKIPARHAVVLEGRRALYRWELHGVFPAKRG